MNVSLTQAKRAVRLFSHEGVDKSIVLHNVKAYLAALHYMGDRYILAKPIVLKRIDSKSVLGIENKFPTF